MNKKTYVYTFWLIFIFIVVAIAFYFFFKSPYYLTVDSWVKQNIILFIVCLFFYKAIGVLFPPIPGGLITMASIPFLGWFGAYLVDIAGSLTGGTLAYFLGRKYGHPLLLKILGGEMTKKIEKVKIKKNREFEAIFMYRLALGSTILEAVYYGAGFLKVGFKNFFISNFFAHVLIGVPCFYVASNIINGSNVILTIVLTLIGVIFILFTKGRYFE